MLKFFKKEIKIPDPKAPAIVIDAVKLWEVSWCSRYGEFSGNTKQEYEVFISKDGAETFQKALKNAFKLLRHTSQTEVTLKEFDKMK